MANQVIWAAYPTAAVVVVLFGLFAGIYTYFRHKKVGKDTTEFFLTARRSVVRLRPKTLLSLMRVRVLAEQCAASPPGHVWRQTWTTHLTDAQGWWRIAWSFYAAAMGSWALFSPGSYAYYAGILGLAMYAFASGTPLAPRPMSCWPSC